MYASHIKPKVSLGLGAGGMQKHRCEEPGNMCQTLVGSVLGGPQSRDVQPVCFPSNGSLARNKALRWRFLHLADGATVDICAQRHRQRHKPRRQAHRCPRDDVSQVKPRPRRIHGELCGTIGNRTRDSSDNPDRAGVGFFSSLFERLCFGSRLQPRQSCTYVKVYSGG